MWITRQQTLLIHCCVRAVLTFFVNIKPHCLHRYSTRSGQSKFPIKHMHSRTRGWTMEGIIQQLPQLETFFLECNINTLKVKVYPPCDVWQDISPLCRLETTTYPIIIKICCWPDVEITQGLLLHSTTKLCFGDATFLEKPLELRRFKALNTVSLPSSQNKSVHLQLSSAKR